MKLPPSWALPAAIKSRLGQRSAGKQRAMVAEEHLLLILHKAPIPGQRDRIPAFFWREPSGRWHSAGSKYGLQPLHQHLQAYTQAEAELSQQYEQAHCAEDYFALLEAMTPLRLATQNLHRALQAAREGIADDVEIIDLRDWAYELERSLDVMHENAKNALDFRLAQRAEEQTQLSMKAVELGNRLNILAAIFFPLTAVSCVFGMNLISGLEGKAITPFWLMVLGGIGLGFWVRRWVLTGRW
ncbi:MAG: CorA family divalent cation transporter [Spirulinaceae cyanobacterium]